MSRHSSTTQTEMRALRAYAKGTRMDWEKAHKRGRELLMATPKRKPAKQKAVTGKSAVKSQIRNEIVVDVKQRYYDSYDAQHSRLGKFGAAKLFIEAIDDAIYVRDSECGEVQFRIPKSTLNALVDEVNKKVEVK
jgi:hypothetical protein